MKLDDKDERFANSPPMQAKRSPKLLIEQVANGWVTIPDDNPDTSTWGVAASAAALGHWVEAWARK